MWHTNLLLNNITKEIYKKYYKYPNKMITTKEEEYSSNEEKVCYVVDHSMKMKKLETTAISLVNIEELHKVIAI